MKTNLVRARITIAVTANLLYATHKKNIFREING